MNTESTSRKNTKASMLGGFIFSAILSFFASIAFINVVNYFFQVDDIGINNAANSMFLTFIVLPISLVMVFIVSIVSFWILRKLTICQKKKYLSYIFVLAIIAVVFFLALDYNFWTLRDYPTPMNMNGNNRSIFWRYVLK
ncbi:hypothetical protein IPN35_00070 [Candidatus Peregrinibacteria bacterium]|nr:MAG: hypothetical protein IPN35_00070 [Candidatus Peregrinibacteria bacterium]